MGRWISLEESEDLAAAGWYEYEGPYGKKVALRQHCPGSPEDRIVWCQDRGNLYLGGWKNGQWNGFGICCRNDGRVIIGHRKNQVLSGPVKRTWLFTAPAWKDNYDENSNIKGLDGRPLPYMYFGAFNKYGKSDKKATIVLKDGTARKGPWENNEPVGDFWSHKVSHMGDTKLRMLLCGKEEEEVTPADIAGDEGIVADSEKVPELVESESTESVENSSCLFASFLCDAPGVLLSG